MHNMHNGGFFMNILDVQGLSKRYERFTLDSVSFSLEKGYIMGFIGANGAGKTTTLKGIMNMIHTDGGRVEVFGREFSAERVEMKQDIAFMLGNSRYYEKRKLETVARTVRRFYANWNEEAFRGYLKRFKLDSQKKIGELSQGMAVKFSLAMALSHEAKLLILDEPTAGLDPAARDNLLELFQELVESGERSILFSTHITSDLERCADFITFINGGRVVGSDEKDAFIDGYRLVSGSNGELEREKESLIAWRKNSFGFQGLMKTGDVHRRGDLQLSVPTLEDIMIYYARRDGESEAIHA